MWFLGLKSSGHLSLLEFVFSRHVLFETFHVDQAALKLLVLLFLPPKFWDAGMCQHTVSSVGTDLGESLRACPLDLIALLPLSCST